MLRKLAGQTAIYGISSIAARLLNYMLAPYLTRIMTTGEYGVVTDLYALIPFVMILLTMGMETGYFRFAGKAQSADEKRRVFQTTWGTVMLASVIFFGVVVFFHRSLAGVMEYAATPSYVLLVAGIVAIDAITALPFAKLREENRALSYVKIRVATVVVNVLLCVTFYSVIPWIGAFQEIFPIGYGAGYYLIANLIASLIAAVMLFPGVRGFRPRIERKLLCTIFLYSLPLLISGIAGVANEFIDRQFIKYLMPGDLAMDSLGIYGAVVKIGVIMLLFVQMYRLAAEPFFLANFKKEDFLKVNAEALKYFFIVSITLFLVITLFTDIFALIIGPGFRQGIFILPVVLLANIGNGVVLNLSFWYKQTGKTKFAIVVTGSGLICTVVLNMVLIPRLGYIGAAWARLGCEIVMVAISYWLNRHYFPTPYNIRRIALYLVAGAILYALGLLLKNLLPYGVSFLANMVLVATFILFAVRIEKIDVKQIVKSILKR